LKKKIFLISGGEIRDPFFLKEQLVFAERSEMICADGGALHLYRLGLVPGVIIGDMDSLDSKLKDHFEARGSRFICYPERKDKTDTQLALEYAYSLKPAMIRIFAATGGRLDHTLANISLLVTGAEKGIDVKLIDDWGDIFIVNKSLVLNGEVGQTVSFFPLTASVEGITLKGFEYPMINGIMKVGYPIGISNRLIAVQGMIAVESGYLLGIRYYKPGIFPVME
jgi:thiamine pyrophosphokinase